VSFTRDFDGSSQPRPDPVTRVAGGRAEDRRAARTSLLGIGTLACSRCDAPVAPAPRPMSPAEAIACPYCRHQATVREFLSLADPARPARVAIRVTTRARARLV
jgi:DNA-directed RNA polymerase subunit RPC12/RpoP